MPLELSPVSSSSPAVDTTAEQSGPACTERTTTPCGSGTAAGSSLGADTRKGVAWKHGVSSRGKATPFQLVRSRSATHASCWWPRPSRPCDPRPHACRQPSPPSARTCAGPTASATTSAARSFSVASEVRALSMSDECCSKSCSKSCSQAAAVPEAMCPYRRAAAGRSASSRRGQGSPPRRLRTSAPPPESDANTLKPSPAPTLVMPSPVRESRHCGWCWGFLHDSSPAFRSEHPVGAARQSTTSHVNTTCSATQGGVT